MITFKRIFISAVLFTLTYSLCAFDFSFNGIGYNIKDENGQKVAQITQPSSLPAYSGDVIIPAEVTYNGERYRVTSIDWYAFGDCEGLTSITLPNTLTLIGGEAFYGCSGLTSISLPNSVITIESGAFSRCSNLRTVIIPSSVKSIYRNVFMNCPAITSISVAEGNTVYDSREGCNAIINKEENMIVTGCMNTIIPNSVTSIGPGAFAGCTGLTSIDFPSGLSVINFSAFSGCTGLTSVNFPTSLWHIGSNAFDSCTGLTSLYIPKRTTSIDDQAFESCSGLETIIVNEENYQYDSRNNCNAIIETKKNRLIAGCKNTIIPNDVTTIEKYTFKNCTGLTSIVIPNSVTVIGNGAFEGCQNLQSINIPNSVTALKGGLFSGCSSLMTVSIPNSVKYIEGGVFSDCSSLMIIVIPSSVIKIADNAFNGCTGLTTMIVQEGNPVFDSRDNCNAIIMTATNTLYCGCKRTVIPNSVTAIGDNAFTRHKTLQTLDIPNSVTSIGRQAFTESGLTSLEIPNSVTSIGEEAFYDCENLFSITLPENLTKLDNRLFCGCTSLTSATIPNSVTEAGTSVFSGCKSLISISISSQLTTIGAYMFRDCSSLSTIDIPSCVTSINTGAFLRCTNLESITIPSGVSTIGHYAFEKCNNLTSVTSEAITPATIDDEVFTNSSNAILYVPEKSVSSYSSAPGWRNFKLIKAIKTVQNYPITYNDPENGILIVAINGEEIESGTMAEENSILTVLAIQYKDYVIESLKLNGNAINNSSSCPVTGPMNIEVTFVREDEDADNINLTSAANQKKCTIYNLSGQRVYSPARGIYIKNGKKLYIR